jgi:predicted enzyme related to lactoylglutathione lyase
MTNSITHFEIYGAEPEGVAEFYRGVFGWRIERMPAVDY